MIVAAAALVMACGGNSDKKADDKKAGEQQEQTKELTVEEQAKAWVDKINNAKSEKESIKFIEEFEKWYESLSEEDMAKADKVLSAEF